MDDLLAAACLVLVLEGLFLFALPGAWKQAVAQLLTRSEQSLRAVGGGMVIAGLVSLWLVRGG